MSFSSETGITLVIQVFLEKTSCDATRLQQLLFQMTPRCERSRNPRLCPHFTLSIFSVVPATSQLDTSAAAQLLLFFNDLISLQHILMLLCCNHRKFRVNSGEGVWDLFIDILSVIYCQCGSVTSSKLCNGSTALSQRPC